MSVKIVHTDKAPAAIKKILALDVKKRNDAQKLEVTKYYRSTLPALKMLESRAAMTSQAPRKPQDQAAGGALAEAMRRAAEKSGRGR